MLRALTMNRLGSSRSLISTKNDFDCSDRSCYEELVRQLDSDNGSEVRDAWGKLYDLPLEYKTAFADWLLERLENIFNRRGSVLLEGFAEWCDCCPTSQDRVEGVDCTVVDTRCPVIATAARAAMRRDDMFPLAAAMLSKWLKRELRFVKVKGGRISPSGSSLLHLAAKAGEAELCHLLLKSGTLPYLRDSKGNTAADIARSHGHFAISELIDGYESRSFRGGLGDAFKDALEDTRPVVQVEWYTSPLPGLANHMLRGKHSLLKVTVSHSSSDFSDSHEYIIEKSGMLSDSPLESHKNGVFISNWQQAAPFLKRSRRPFRTLSGPSVKPGLTMASLRKMAVDMGSYDMKECNAHQAALLLYNACCATDDAITSRMPNPQVRLVEHVLNQFGQDYESIRQTLSKSTWRRETSRFIFKLGAEPHSCLDHLKFLMQDIEYRDHTHKFAGRAAELAAWSYSAVKPDQKGMLVLTSDLPVQNHVMIEETGERVTLESGGIARVSFDKPFEDVSVIVEKLGGSCFGSVLCHQKIQVGKRYRLVSGAQSSVHFVEDSGLPEGFEAQVVKHSTDDNIVSWSAVTSDSTVWVSFRGTENMVDAIVDLAAISFDHADHGLQVHGGMWLSLTQQSSHTLNQVNEAIAELQKQRPKLKNVVFCGHSLGGGYAILAALDRLHRNLPVTSVCAFGAPQVVVPDRNLEIWQRLHAVTTHYVNSWDLVPRMPSCLPWMFHVLPGALPDKISLKLGQLQIGVKAGGDAIVQHLGRQTGIFAKYDAVGTLVFIRRGTQKVICVESSDSGKHRELLGTQPPRLGGFVLEQHSVQEYASIIPALF